MNIPDLFISPDNCLLYIKESSVMILVFIWIILSDSLFICFFEPVRICLIHVVQAEGTQDLVYIGYGRKILQCFKSRHRDFLLIAACFAFHQYILFDIVCHLICPPEDYRYICNRNCFRKRRI